MDEGRQILLRTIQEDAQTLHNIIRSYVVRMGLASNMAAEATTQEIVNEMVIAALKSAESYDPSRRPIPWLLGIAINRIQRCLSQNKRENEREIAVRDLYPGTQDLHSDEELFERFAQIVTQPDKIERQEQLDILLAPLSETDREILKLAVLQDLDSLTIGEQLSISPSAVRVRLHRALKRLRGHFELQEALTHED
jgi:RNA polymerase sigma-70 factor, ECF subfamily